MPLVVTAAVPPVATAVSERQKGKFYFSLSCFLSVKSPVLPHMLGSINLVQLLYGAVHKSRERQMSLRFTSDTKEPRTHDQRCS